MSKHREMEPDFYTLQLAGNLLKRCLISILNFLILVSAGYLPNQNTLLHSVDSACCHEKKMRNCCSLHSEKKETTGKNMNFHNLFGILLVLALIFWQMPNVQLPTLEHRRHSHTLDLNLHIILLGQNGPDPL